MKGTRALAIAPQGAGASAGSGEGVRARRGRPRGMALLGLDDKRLLRAVRSRRWSQVALASAVSITEAALSIQLKRVQRIDRYALLGARDCVAQTAAALGVARSDVVAVLGAAARWTQDDPPSGLDPAFRAGIKRRTGGPDWAERADLCVAILQDLRARAARARAADTTPLPAADATAEALRAFLLVPKSYDQIGADTLPPLDRKTVMGAVKRRIKGAIGSKDLALMFAALEKPGRRDYATYAMAVDSLAGGLLSRSKASTPAAAAARSPRMRAMLDAHAILAAVRRLPPGPKGPSQAEIARRIGRRKWIVGVALRALPILDRLESALRLPAGKSVR